VSGRDFLLAMAIVGLSVLPSGALAERTLGSVTQGHSPPGGAQPAVQASEPTDAVGFSRRAGAFAARGDFVRAIADLTRACQLAPSQPEYFYLRAMARWGNSQPQLAMADFDQALTLAPHDVPALVSRAELRLALRDPAGAAVDLDAAARSAPKGADVRFTLGDLYTRMAHFAPALAQYDLWIAAHPDGPHTAAGFKARCWARGLWGQQLNKALNDCNRALRLKPDTAGLLDSRALVELRLGELDKAIGDYDRALRSEPKNAWLLYARGVAELHAGRKVAGQADIAAAQVLQPLISAVGRQRRVTP
jgi:tetratricopeptide (TPR) repeat protein